MNPEVELPAGVSPFGDSSVPADGFGVVARHAATGHVHESEVELPDADEMQAAVKYLEEATNRNGGAAGTQGQIDLVVVGVWGAMERKVRLASAVSGVSERPELAPSDRFRYGERVASQQVDVLVAER